MNTHLDTTTGADRRQRVFFALWPEPAASAALHAFALRMQARCGGRVMRAETLHLTLAFLGDLPVQRINALRTLAAQVHGEAFDLEIARAGSWKRNRVLWAAPRATPPALADLADALASALRAAGYALEERPFSPHLTLIRNAREAPPPDIEPPATWHAERFALVRSRPDAKGAHYETLADWPLAAPRETP